MKTAVISKAGERAQGPGWGALLGMMMIPVIVLGAAMFAHGERVSEVRDLARADHETVWRTAETNAVLIAELQVREGDTAKLIAALSAKLSECNERTTRLARAVKAMAPKIKGRARAPKLIDEVIEDGMAVSTASLFDNRTQEEKNAPEPVTIKAPDFGER